MAFGGINYYIDTKIERIRITNEGGYYYMIDATEAVQLYKTEFPKEKIIGILENKDFYIIMIDGVGLEGFSTVDKESGNIGTIWIWDLLEEDNKDHLNDITDKVLKTDI